MFPATPIYSSNKTWTSIKATVATRWWSLFDHLASFLENKETFVYLRDAPAKSKSLLIPPDVHLLSDKDWVDIECIKDVVGPFKQAQQKFELQVHHTIYGDSYS